MAEVPDHLVPASRVSDARIRFAGLDTLEGGGGGVFRFDLFEGDACVGTFRFEIGPTGKGIDHMVALAHQKMNDALRQMLHENELIRQAYGQRSA